MQKHNIGKVIIILSVVSLVIGIIYISQTGGTGGDSISDDKKFISSNISLFNKEVDGLALINISGVISFYRESNILGITKFGTRDIIDLIKKAKESKKVKGLILRVNSPGGTIAASQEIYEAVKDFKTSKKPVVISMGDIAASGAYYISAPADKIIANPGTVTGSIGVYMSSLNFAELIKKVGIKMNIVKSDKHKDIFSPFRDMTDTESVILNSTIKIFFSQFKNAVLVNRKNKLDNKKYNAIFDGRIFSGEEALELGLIDELGTLETAIKTAGKLAGIKGKPEIVDIEGSKKYFKFLINSFYDSKKEFFSALLANEYVPFLYMR